MKKFFKKSMLAVMFTFTFLFMGVSVKAAVNVVKDNTNMSENVNGYKVGENQQYVVSGSAEEAEITLTSISTSTKAGFIIKTEKALLAKVSVVKCETLDTDSNVCKRWVAYTYNEDKKVTMDALKKGLVLNFQEKSFAPIAGVTELNGVTLSNLSSIHGLEDTYFVLVQYEAYRTILKNDVFDTEVYKLVFSDDLASLEIEAEKKSDGIEVTAQSGLPIVSIKYFHTDKKLEIPFDFATEYKNAGNGETIAVENGNYAAAEGEIYSLEALLPKIEKGEYYYVEATDVAGNKVLKDLDSKTRYNDPGSEENTPKFTNTPVGKIILMILLGILVVALVLVIVQKIIDKRKKLY